MNYDDLPVIRLIDIEQADDAWYQIKVIKNRRHGKVSQKTWDYFYKPKDHFEGVDFEV